MKKKLLISGVAAVLLALLLCSYVYIRDNKAGNFDAGAELFVYPDMTPDDVIAQLDSQVVIKHPKALRKVFRKKEVATYIMPGHYEINDRTSSVELARMLNNGWQTPVRLVLGGTLRNRGDIAAKIASQLMFSKEDMLAAFEDRTLLASLGFEPSNVFALLIPDTYSCYWTATPWEVLNIQKKAYDQFWTPDNDRKAKELGLSRMEVSILASIVKGETNYEPEMNKIAGVYLNRLRTGMLLQADPTVAYCFNYELDRILLKHLEVDSPYNTYKHQGLPPGPICTPTKACLEAVLNPDYGGGNKFFCASPEFNGTHRFARTLSEHNANAAAFHRALTIRRRARTAGK